MIRLSTPKRVFKFYLPDGNIGFVEDIPNLEEADRLVREVDYQSFLAHEISYERDWRNYELTNTDWMLVADSTHSGEPLAGSEKLEDIMAYRLALRTYNLTTDDRPSRPDWFM